MTAPRHAVCPTRAYESAEDGLDGFHRRASPSDLAEGRDTLEHVAAQHVEARAHAVRGHFQPGAHLPAMS